MRALVYQGPLDVAVIDLPDPAPDAGGAVVEVEACGICGSDLHIYEGHGFSPTTGYCVGHEAVGRVVAVGAGTTSVSEGDRVIIPASTGCATCDRCAVGDVINCRTGQSGCYGLGPNLQGSQAQYVKVPHAARNLIPWPDEISVEAALLLTDNLPTAWFGTRRADIAPGADVVVVGLGPVGLCAVQSAYVLGAGRVFGVDKVPERRAAAESFGAIALGDEPRDELLAHTAGRGASSVIEAVGADATIDLAVKLCALDGTVSVVGVNQNMAMPFPMPIALVKNLTYRIGLCSVQAQYPELLPLVTAGRLRPDAVVSSSFPLSQGAEAYRRFHGREAGTLKVMLDPAH